MVVRNGEASPPTRLTGGTYHLPAVGSGDGFDDTWDDTAAIPLRRWAVPSGPARR